MTVLIGSEPRTQLLTEQMPVFLSDYGQSVTIEEPDTTTAGIGLPFLIRGSTPTAGIGSYQSADRCGRCPRRCRTARIRRSST